MVPLEIVHFQHGGLKWHSHLVAVPYRKNRTYESLAWKHFPAEEIRIFHERVSFLSFQREYAQRPHAPPIYRWFADVRNGQTRLADEFVWYGLRMAVALIKLMITIEWGKIMTANVYFRNTMKNCPSCLSIPPQIDQD